MKKAKVTLIIFLFLLSILICPQFVKGFYCFAHSLETDKDTYYTYENITISAHWELDYNPATELAYVCVLMYDTNYLAKPNPDNEFLWCTPYYDQIGEFEKEWNVSIYDLNLDLINTPKELFIKFYYFYLNEEMFVEQFFLITKKVDVVKKDVSCELTNFKDSIPPQESLIFDARFYDALNYSDLVGKNITFTTKVDNMTFYQDRYLTNSSGMIHLNLTVSEELSLGHNYLIFELKNDDFGSFSNDMIRISYTTAFDKLKEAMDRIEEFTKSL